MCPKLQGDKIDQIKREYMRMKARVDEFDDLRSSLYSSSVSWMDSSYFKWTDEDRSQFRNRVFHRNILRCFFGRAIELENEEAFFRRFFRQQYILN